MGAMGLFTFAGVLEGFYGKPWSWEQRRSVMERCVPAGLPWYCWAPKSDPLHRSAWREPFTDEYLAGFADLLSIDGLKLCIGIAPGMEPGAAKSDDAEVLGAKLAPVIELVEAAGSHVPMVMVAFDDLGPELTDPRRHGQLISSLGNQFGDRIVLGAVPVHYATTAASDYLRAFSEELPADVLIGWTGELVVNEQIHAAQAEAFADAVDGRPLLLWDNYPVNDAFMKNRLFLRPLRGRDDLLSEFCAGYLANAGVQPLLSLPPLLSAAAWCETGTATEVWDEFDQPVQLALLSEACEGRELYRLALAATEDAESSAFDDLWCWS
jgi:hyaluronoglucosaminidase